MDYQGKLYGKICGKCFDTGKTTYHYDGLIKELEETVTDLKILRNQIATEERMGWSHRFNGMSELIDQWIEKKEMLIKESK